MTTLKDIIIKIFDFSRTEPPAPPAQPPTAPAAETPTPETPPATPEVEEILARMARQKRLLNLDWENSIVDLLKLLGLDSSAAARRELAKELHYTGNMNNNIAMNMWLHQEVMNRLAEHGGKWESP